MTSGKRHVSVNGERLDEAMVEQELALLRQRCAEELSPGEMKEREAQIAADARENAIERLLLVQEARKMFADVQPSDLEKRFRELLRGRKRPSAEDESRIKSGIADDIRLGKYFDVICRNVAAATEPECKARYEEQKDSFRTTEMVCACHIVRRPLPDQDPGSFFTEMLNIREQALKGADFSGLAGKYSQCRDNGGDLGWFPRGTMTDRFESVVFALKPGEVSDIFWTEFGCHIAKVKDYRPARDLAFEEVRAQIENALLEERKNEEIGRVVDRLRETAGIVELPDEP